jgi:tRNA(His) 5'-end guanylyltransferase
MDLGDRMKNYEKAYDVYMPSRLPVIVRIDGKGFSKFTKSIKAKKPFDEFFSNTMSIALKAAAEKIEGCVFGYTQSDEMTFVIKNDQSLESTPWFGNRTQKITSVVSSLVTAHFNKRMISWYEGNVPLAYFDARTFVVPSWQEAINCLVWRQNDATKNSISSACYYDIAEKIGKKTARKKMHGLNQKQQQELLFQETGLNWNNYKTKFKRGIGVYRVSKEITLNGETFIRNSWQIDEELPIFAQDQEFLKDILDPELETHIGKMESME